MKRSDILSLFFPLLAYFGGEEVETLFDCLLSFSFLPGKGLES